MVKSGFDHFGKTQEEDTLSQDEFMEIVMKVGGNLLE